LGEGEVENSIGEEPEYNGNVVQERAIAIIRIESRAEERESAVLEN